MYLLGLKVFTLFSQPIKFGQLIENGARNIFLQKSCSKWSREISYNAFLFLKKLKMRSKPAAVVTNLVSIYFGSPRLWDTKKQTV